MGGQRPKTGHKKKPGANAGVGVDFKRVKHKVGRKLPKAQNETDTSFKSRSINLPSQTVVQDKDGVATNFQNLTLKASSNMCHCVGPSLASTKSSLIVTDFR
jgi:pre-rRNA-processing protein IPI1